MFFFSGQTFNLSSWVFDQILSKLITFQLASADTFKSHFNLATHFFDRLLDEEKDKHIEGVNSVWPPFVDLSADIFVRTIEIHI